MNGWQKLSITISIAIALAAGWQIIGELYTRPLVNFATSLERSNTVRGGDPILKTRLAAEVARVPGCARDAARARVTVTMYLLRNNDASPESLADALQQSSAALACNPLDGNLWLMTGWLSEQSSPNAARFRDHVMASIAHSPFERAALTNRWRVLAPRLKAYSLESDPYVLADLDRILSRASQEIAASVYRGLVDGGSDAVALAAVGRLAPQRRSGIRRALGDIPAPAWRPRQPTLPLTPFDKR